MIEGGKTPVLPKEQLTEMGFHLILYPLSGLYAAAQTMHFIYKKLYNDGTTMGENDRLMSFKTFNELIGVENKYAMAKRFGEK